MTLVIQLYKNFKISWVISRVFTTVPSSSCQTQNYDLSFLNAARFNFNHRTLFYYLNDFPIGFRRRSPPNANKCCRCDEHSVHPIAIIYFFGWSKEFDCLFKTIRHLSFIRISRFLVLKEADKEFPFPVKLDVKQESKNIIHAPKRRSILLAKCRHRERKQTIKLTPKIELTN